MAVKVLPRHHHGLVVHILHGPVIHMAVSVCSMLPTALQAISFGSVLLRTAAGFVGRKGTFDAAHAAGSVVDWAWCEREERASEILVCMTACAPVSVPAAVVAWAMRTS
jgi:hypothetical protein